MIQGKNPILGMDYPDPDVIRVDDTYYMVTTTMHFFPGCEILRSYDLINWEHLTYVYDRLDSTEGQTLTGDKNVFGKGMWAASLRFHKGLFYIVFVANDTHKTYLYRSEAIEGPWRKSEIEGFYHDASLLFDDEGDSDGGAESGSERVFIVYGNTDIYLTELRPDLTGPLEGGLHRLIVSDKGNPMLGYEGSHLYKINGRYYLFLIHSAWNQWMRREAVFSSDSLEGEFTGGEVLSDDLGRPHMGAAQGGIVDDPDGNWYSVVFQDCGAIGRIPVVVPVTWEGNVPVFGTDGKVPRTLYLSSMKPEHSYEALYGSDDFKDNYFKEYKSISINDSVNNDKSSNEECSLDKNSDTVSRMMRYGCFGLRSFWQFSHEPDLSLVEVDKEKGILRVTTDKISENIFQARNVLTQRMILPDCSGEVTVSGKDLREGDVAGLAVYQGNFLWVGITRREGKLYALVSSFTSHEDTWTLTREPGVEHEILPLDTDTLRVRIDASFVDMEGTIELPATEKNEKSDENRKSDVEKNKDSAQCRILLNGEWKTFGPSHTLSFRLDHFTGARFGLFTYSTKEPGGTAEFSDFIYK